jgi:SNF2 family DNA or RNA helicase
LKLYTHQKNAIKNGVLNKKYAIYHEQGLGKTFTAIAIARWAIEKDNFDCIYVVCPAFLKTNWLNEINKFDPILIPKFKIFSYEKFTKLPELVRKQVFFLIVDEAHYIRNRRTYRTNAVVTAAMRAQRVLLLTGTPVGNSGILDLYTHLVCLNHRHDYAKYSNFVKNFVHTVMINNKFPVKTSKNESLFLEVIGQYSERKTKNECLDLPDKVYVEIPSLGEKVPRQVHIQYKLMAQEGFEFITKDTVYEFKAHDKKLLVLLIASVACCPISLRLFNFLVIISRFKSFY